MSEQRKYRQFTPEQKAEIVLAAGPLTAAKVIAETAGVARFRSEAARGQRERQARAPRDTRRLQKFPAKRRASPLAE